MLQAPYVGICEFVTFGKLRRFLGSSSSWINRLVLQVAPKIGYSMPEATWEISLDSVGEDETTMFKLYIVYL